MSEPTGTEKPLVQRNFSLPHFNRLCITAGLAFALMGCTSITPQSQEHPTIIINYAPTPSSTIIQENDEIINLLKTVEEGKKMQTDLDKEMFKNTRPGVDLRFSDNPTVAKIRTESDLTRRFLLAVGFLDVEKNPRYSNPETWTCNVYAIDLIRLLYNNEAANQLIIGSRYNKSNLTPQVAGIAEIGRMTKKQYDNWNKANPSFDSNVLDWWMEHYGVTIGWEKVTDFNKFVGIPLFAATKRELIDTGEINVGHAFILFPLGNDKVAYTQSTANKRLVIVNNNQSDVHTDILGSYSYWAPPRSTLPLQATEP